MSEADQKRVRVATLAVDESPVVLLSDTGVSVWTRREFYWNGSDPVKIGGSTVTSSGATTDGIILNADNPSYVDDITQAAWYAICATGETASVTVVEYAEAT